MLDVAVWVYISIAFVTIITLVRYWMRSYDSITPNRSCAEESTTLVQRQVPSKSQPISMQRPLQSDIEQQSHLTGDYAVATWNMYTLIVSAREARARCGACMGSMETNRVTIVTVGESRENKKGSNDDIIPRSSEEHHLIRSCPSPHYLGSMIKEKLRIPVLRAHRDYYYGATVEHTCPHRNLIMSGENMVFQFDL